jgi:soluble cytochrome b562
MKKMCTISALILVLGLSALCGVASAHGTEMHDKTVQADIQMNKLHAMMPMLSLASAELEAALEKGDATAAKTQADRILAAVPDLKKSRPHRNAKQLKTFVGLAMQLQKTVTATEDLVNKGDFAGAKAAFKKVEKTCAACHARFRD